MRKSIIRTMTVTVLIALVLVSAMAVAAKPAKAVLCQKMFIPAYFYPGSLWDQADAGAPIVDVMIMNPASGPGTSIDSNYVAAVGNARAAGIKVIGYVHTSYGARDINVVKSEVDLYKLWYGVDGIFLDEVSSSAADLAYYQEAANYIRATAGTYVALNPGVVPDESYISIGDTTVIFENTYNVYRTWSPPSWVNNYAASKFTHLVHATSSNNNMKKAISWSKSRNAGNVYVTNDVLPNPWDTLPSYWNSELTQINAGC